MNGDILQQVITYNEAGLALLENQNCFVSTSNKRFERFNDDIPKNLGSVVNFAKPPRLVTGNSLVVSFQPAVQRVQSLSVTNQYSTAIQFTAQQFIFNAREYIQDFAKTAIAELGASIEADVASVAETNTYRFYGDGVTPINSYLQLANALEFFRNYGSALTDFKGYLSNLTYPAIVNSGLNQFALDRNNREAMSWEVGEFSGCEWYRSNLLKTHLSGTEGNAGSVLTVVSTTLDANGAVTAITFSGTDAASDANSIKQYDKFQFSDGVSGLPNMRFLTWIGYRLSQVPVQFRAEANAGSTGGSQVTVNIFPALQVNPGQDQNINNPILPGMQVTVLPNHRCGLITSGNPLFLAMPKLPDTTPYPSSSAVDKETGASMRTYYGYLFGQNEQGIIHDAITGYTLADEYSMMVALPM